jgi:hypothetical protein
MALDSGGRLESQAIEGIGPEVADEDVGGGEEVLKVLAVIGLVQVKHDAAFAPVVEGEGRIGHVAVDTQ